MKIISADLFTATNMRHIKLITNPENVNVAFDEAYQHRLDLGQSILVRHIKIDENGETVVENETYDIKYA